jgi:hypothetical protein
MLHGMGFLNLSVNKFDWSNPPEIAGIDTNLALSSLLLYDNDLSGAIPAGLDDPVIAVYIDCGEITCVYCVDKGGLPC